MYRDPRNTALVNQKVEELREAGITVSVNHAKSNSSYLTVSSERFVEILGRRTVTVRISDHLRPDWYLVGDEDVDLSLDEVRSFDLMNLILAHLERRLLATKEREDAERAAAVQRAARKSAQREALASGDLLAAFAGRVKSEVIAAIRFESTDRLADLASRPRKNLLRKRVTIASQRVDWNDSVGEAIREELKIRESL